MALWKRSLVVLATALVLNPIAGAAQTPTLASQPTAPLQPSSGPGGADYAYGAVSAQHYGPAPDGTVDAAGYWLFEPIETGNAPAPHSVPLIIFFHGYQGTDPHHYRAWIDHLVRRGAVVLYPDFQPLEDVLLELCPYFCREDQRPTLPLALAAIRAGLAELGAGGHTPVDLTKVGVAGHSWGGMLAAKYAAVATAEGLPAPAAVMPVMPGCGCPFATELAAIPEETRVVVLVGADDDVVYESFARQMWASMAAVPLEQRDYIRLVSDDHGDPPLLAAHSLAATDGEWGPLDAYDWYGTWKLLDGLLGCAFAGVDCGFALGDTPDQRFMGTWSDSTPVVDAQVTDDPATL
jgi:acetyl esterase/lipase